MDELYTCNVTQFMRTFKSESWAFILVCTYLFFEYVRPQSIYPAISEFSFVPVILGLAILMAIVDGRDAFRRKGNINDKLIVLYSFVVLLSSVTSQYPSLSFSQWRAFFDWFLIYFIITAIVNNEKRFFLFFALFLLFSFKMSQHGFRTWAMRGFSFATWGVTGAPGWFQNSGEVGIQMCIFVPLAVAFIVAVRKFVTKKWFCFLLVMPFTGIATAIASSSRGALIGLGAAGVWAILRRPKIFFVGAMILAIVASGVYLAIPENSMERFETSGNDNTSLQRLERWKAGIKVMGQFPLLGVGFNAWDKYYPAHFNIEHRGSLLMHNIFIQCGSELGYSGLIVFIAMIFSCLLITKKIRKLAKGKSDQFLSTISYGFDSALIGFLVSGSFVTVLYYPYFWIHCALTTCLYTSAYKKYALQKP